MGDTSPISRRSSVLFGIHSENKDLENFERAKWQNRRFTVIAASALFLLILSLISIILVEVYTTTAIVPFKNHSQQKLEHLEDLVKAQKWNMIQDIILEPAQKAQERWKGDVSDTAEIFQTIPLEKDDIQERWDHVDADSEKIYNLDEEKNEEGTVKMHNNHRYDNSAPRPVSRVGWQPRPFTMEHIDSTKSSNKINEVDAQLPPTSTSQHPVSPEPATAKPKKPVWFRGYYLHPKNQDPAYSNARNSLYYDAINNFFRRQRQAAASSVKDSQPQLSNVVGKISVVPPGMDSKQYYQNINEFFQSNLPSGEDLQTTTGEKQTPSAQQASAGSELHTQAIFHPYGKPGTDTSSKTWNRKKTNPKGKPFTVMLDIYPMETNKEEEREGEKKLPRLPYRPRDTIFLPMKPNAEYFKPNVQGVQATRYFMPQLQMTPPKQKRKNRMFMKLNLFPKGQQANRRTWGLWNNDEEAEEEEWRNKYSCNGGKPITAKWKGQNGEWVHAKLVTMHEYGDRMDNIDPR